MKKIITGNVLDIFNRKIYPAEIHISKGKIQEILETGEECSGYILPGLVDSHIHIESSMLTPARFAEAAVKHGTVAVVTDPHEIANVAGLQGVEFMIENAKTVPMKFFFGAPSCVPATEFETSGARIGSEEVRLLLEKDEILFLSEMMNFPGVLGEDPEVVNKLKHARELKKPVDGHAPGLTGEDLLKYIRSGISTDHECLTFQEAAEKISSGMKVQIREGSAARGFDMFRDLIDMYPESVMLCTDDMHPDDLLEGHIDRMIRRGLEKGVDLFNLLRAAIVNPVIHYGLPAGLLRKGDPADMIEVTDLQKFEITGTWINGEKVYSEGKVLFVPGKTELECKFRNKKITLNDISVGAESAEIRVIEAYDGKLYTGALTEKVKKENGFAVADTDRDICKMVLVNRYNDNNPAVAFIKGFGLKRGAIAGSVAHDSHNIIAVGVNDEDIKEAVNRVIEMGGGLVSLSDERRVEMPLEVGGLMTNSDGINVARKYGEIDGHARQLGSNLSSPFMTLSFMALLVIPRLKLSDHGLFDGEKFEYVSLFI